MIPYIMILKIFDPIPLPLVTNGVCFNKILTKFNPIFHFYTPETKGFLTFSGGIEMEHWLENIT